MAALHAQLAGPEGDPSRTGHADVAGAGTALGRDRGGVEVDAVGGSGTPGDQGDVAGQGVAGIGADLTARDPDRPVGLQYRVAACVEQRNGRQVGPGHPLAGQVLA